MEKLKKLSAIVVDDSSMTLEMLKFILRSEHYPVIGEASNGRDAIELCARKNPGLVLLDINMPKMDGLQALEEIRKISPATIVLMVSAEATMDKVNEAMEKGADGFIVKPLNPASVLDKIAMCIKRKRIDKLTRILYVEDGPSIQMVAQLALEALGGYTVEICSSGDEALQRAPEFQPQLFLLDVMMPGMDGPSTLKMLRALPQFAYTPVVFVTAKVQPDALAGYKKLGVVDVIPKPFDPMILVSKVQEIWERCHG